MTERPILFQGAMVRAILGGSKSQTRRLVKPHPPAHVVDFCTFHNPKGDGLAHFGFDPVARELQEWFAVCPYGQVGDRLWVRETWGVGSRPDPWGGYDGIEYRADQAWLEEGDDLPCNKVQTPDDVCLGDYRAGWKPSIHMPRWACRITLEVTGVRVERLQDISRGDAMAEGCPFPKMAQGDDPRRWYAELWEQINGPGSWVANPWVWVVEFRRLDGQA